MASVSKGISETNILKDSMGMDILQNPLLQIIIKLQNVLTSRPKSHRLMIGFNDQEFKNLQSKLWFEEDEQVLKVILKELQQTFNLNSIIIKQKVAPGYFNEFITTIDSDNENDKRRLQELKEICQFAVNPDNNDSISRNASGFYKNPIISSPTTNDNILVIPCRVNIISDGHDNDDGIFGFLGYIPTDLTYTITKEKFNIAQNQEGLARFFTMIANQLGLYFSHLNFVRKKALNNRLRKIIETIDTRFSYLENPNDSKQIINDLANFVSQVFDFHDGAIYTYDRVSNTLSQDLLLDSKITNSVTIDSIASCAGIMETIKNTNALDNSNRLIDIPVRYIFPLTSTFGKKNRCLIVFDSEFNLQLTKDEFELVSYRLKDKVGFHLQAAENIDSRIASISDIVELLNNLSNPDVMQDKMIGVIANHLKVDIISYMEVDQSQKYLTFKKGQGQCSEIIPGCIKEPIENSISGLAVKYGKTIYIKDIDNLDEVQNNFPKEARDDLKRLFSAKYKTSYHTRSLLSVPLIKGKGSDFAKVIGVINVNNKDNKKIFTEKDKAFLEAISDLVAAGINNVNFIDESKQREILNKAANDIQMSLMPTSQDFKRLPKEIDIFGESTTAKEVGGDLFEIVKMQDGRLLTILGDVSGKGNPAAIIMAIAQTFIKTLAPEHDNLIDILLKANKYLSAEMEGMDGKFVTLQLVAIDLETGNCEFANAGHGPLLVSRKDSIEEIKPGKGMPLGLFDPPFMPYNLVNFKLNPDDFFVMFTDGLYEEISPSGEMFGMERIKEIMKANSNKDSKSIYSALKQACQNWKQGADAHDDLTILSVKYRGIEND